MSNGNQGNPLSIIATIVGLIVATYVASSILIDPGNQLAGLFYYVMLGSGVLGVIAPRLSFTLFILQCAYLDLFKRLMVIAGNITFTDLFWVLGIAPVTVMGISAGLLLRLVFGKVASDGGDFRRFLIAVCLNVTLAVVIFTKGGGVGGTLREVANGSTYAYLLFIVPLLFRTPESVTKCTRTIIIIFLPVVVYTVYQQIFGFQAFEIEYLKTGLSIEIKQLEADRVRAFGTLNSPTSISVVACSMGAMAMALSTIGKLDRKLGLSKPAALVITLMCVAAWAASTVRVGILLMPVSLAGTYLFLRPSTTRWFYGTLAAGFAVLVATSSYMYRNIEIWTYALVDKWAGSLYVEQMINMNSYKDRLYGFYMVLLNPQAYSLFGLSNAGEDVGLKAHDPIGNALLSFGVVPLGIVLITASWGMWRLHKVIFGMRNRVLQLLAASFLANAAGNIAVSIVNGNLLGTFPVNVFFWVSLAFAISLRHADATLTASLPPEPVTADRTPGQRLQPPPGVSPGRFTPVARFNP